MPVRIATDIGPWTLDFWAEASVNQQKIARLLDAHRPVIQFLAVQKYFNQRRTGQVALNQRFRKRVFDVLLQSASQWAGSVRSVDAGLIYNPAFGLFGKADFKTVPGHRAIDLIDL